MKRTFKTVIRALTGTALFIANAYAADNTTMDAAAAMTDRKALVESAAIERVYAIDGHHTFVVGQGAILNNAKGLTVVKEFKRGEIAPVEAYLLRHDEAQPFVYKSPAIAHSEPLTAAKKLSLSSLISTGDAYVEVDLAQQAIAECAVNGNVAEFVIPRRSGNHERLTLTGAATAFDYIVSSAAQDTAWFAACPGADGFLVEKYYSHRTTMVKRAGFFPGRTLAGVNYAAEAAPANDAVEAEYDPAQHEDARSQAALETAMMKTSLVKPLGNIKYTGVYNGEYKKTGCGHVTVKVTGRLSLKNTLQAKAYDFKVCNDKAAFLGENNTVDTRHVYAAYTK